MTRHFKVFLFVLLGTPLVIACLIGINFLICARLLHINGDVIASVSPLIVPVARPLVFKADARNGRQRWADWMLPALGVTDDLATIPADHPQLISIAWILKANPYPPILAEFSEGYKDQINYCSFGYIGVDNQYHQVTVAGGEADSMPSFLVRKARGKETHWGDYFVNYAFVLTGKPESLPQIDHIEWASHRGGSYNALEEITFNAVATLVELCLLGIAVSLLSRHRLRRKRAGTHLSLRNH